MGESKNFDRRVEPIMLAGDGKNILADELRRKGHVRTTPVEAAFRVVPRHLFVPEVDPDQAYRDVVVPIEELPGGKVESSASQPAIVAQMLEQLSIEPGDRVLEVGAATGYNAALIAHLVGEGGHVVTVEIDESLARRARESLAAAGFGQVEVVHADGGLGHPAGAPYDRIIVTAGAPDITPAWREQLALEGRLVLPLELWPGLQVCAAFEPAEDHLGREHLVSVAAVWCGFLRMGGEFAAPESDPDEGTVSGTALEARLRGLRDASLASGLPFPEWFRMRAYPRESGCALDPEELVIEKRWSRLVLDQL